MTQQDTTRTCYTVERHSPLLKRALGLRLFQCVFLLLQPPLKVFFLLQDDPTENPLANELSDPGRVLLLKACVMAVVSINEMRCSRERKENKDGHGPAVPAGHYHSELYLAYDENTGSPIDRQFLSLLHTHLCSHYLYITSF